MADQDDSTLGGARDADGAPLRIDRYRVIDRLGEGGMGEVLLARDEELGRELALKVVRGARPDAHQVARFLREARITGQLEHPNIVPVHELGTARDGTRYFTMKRIEGRTLERLLEEPPERPELLQIFLKVCDAVAFAHSRRIVHRDLKPSNIMIGRFGEVLVVDWGTAFEVGSRQGEVGIDGGEEDPFRTQDGAVIGTPAYMAPEQARGELDRVDGRSDIYSLGAVLYEMLTGEHAFQGANARDVLRQARQGAAGLEAARHLPREIEAVVRKAMAARPVERYQSAAELKADVERYLTGGLLVAARYNALQRAAKWVARHRTASLVAASALLVIGGLLGWQRWRDQTALRRALRAGQVALERGRHDEALRLYERALHLQPGSEAARSGRRRAQESQRAARVQRLAAEATRQLAGLPAAAELARMWDDRRRQTVAGAAAPLESMERREARESAFRGYLAAAATLDRARMLDPADPELRRRRREAGEALGYIALLGGDHTLAKQAFADLAHHGGEARAVGALVALADAARTAEPRRRKARLEAMLADIRAGLARAGRDPQSPDLTAYSVEAAGFRDLQTVQIVGEALAPLVRKAREQGKRAIWTQRERELARFACGVLGELRLAQAIEPLAAWIAVVEDPTLAVVAGWSLCGSRLPEAYAPLVAARRHFGENSTVWRRIRTLFARVPIPRELAGPRAQALLDRGVARREQGDPAGALADFNRVLALDRRSVAALVNRGNLHLAHRRYPEAIADYSAALKLDGRRAAAWINRGNAYQRSGRLDLAAADYRSVLQINPRSVDARNNLGLIYKEQGKLAEAVELFRHALHIDPQSDLAAKNLAATLVEQGQLDPAIVLCRQLLARNPRHAGAHNVLGLVLQKQGKLQAAIDSFSQALVLDPRFEEACYNRGQTRQQQGDAAGAIADYTLAIRIRPTHPPYVNRGTLLMSQGRVTKALADFEQAVALAPKLAAAWYNRGLARQKLGDAAGALADYTRAVQLDPRHAEAYLNRGNLHRARGEFDAARADYDRAIAAAPQQASGYLNRGIVHAEQGDHGAALVDFDHALRLEPRSVEAWYNRGLSRHGRKDLDGAVADFRRAIALDPRHAASHTNLAMVLQQQGKQDEAIAGYREAVRHDPRIWQAWANLGLALKQRGERPAAIEALQRARRLAPPAARAQIESTLRELGAR